MVTKWTPSQQNAINDRGRSLVVSAGAGSGKTSVLTERVLQKLLSGADIESFLIVTFTNAAAFDLREKLYEGLNKALANQPDNTHLYRQLFAIESSNISTIHSFCLDLIKQNFQTLSLPPKLRVADDAEAALLLDRCADNLFDSKYENQDGGFLMLVKQLTDQKGDKSLKEALIEIYNKVLSYPSPALWFAEIENQLELEKEKAAEFFDTNCGEILKTISKEIIKSAEILLEKAQAIKGGLTTAQNNVFTVLGQHFTALNNALSKGYNAAQTVLIDAKSPSFRADKNAIASEEGAELKTAIWEMFKSLRTQYADTTQDIFADIAVALRIHQEIAKLFFALEEDYSAAKRERGLVDFADIEHLTLALLTDKAADEGRSDICRRLSEDVEEIYIDEYQDTSPVQDAIFSLVAKPNNKFIVGDIKQSLYRFRNAEPDIFTDCINNAADFADGGSTARIFLKENFRCDNPIIEFTNTVFEKAYHNIYGSYGDNERLIFGKEKKEAPEQVMVAEIEGEPEDEADFVADEILRYKAEGKKQDGSALSFSDFAIITRAPKTDAEPLLRVLQAKGIPVYTEQSGSFLKTPEILLAVSLLKAVDNPRDDISLTSLMRSPLFGFTDSMLAEIRITDINALGGSANLGSMYDSLHCCVRRYRARLTNKKFIFHPALLSAKPGKMLLPMPSVRAQTAEKIDIFLRKLSHWRRKSEGLPSYKFIWYILGSTGLYSLASNDKNSEVMQRNLLLLYEHARMFERTTFKGLSSFISYLNEIYESKKPLSEAPAISQNNDCVRIMSIHKSKGLQYEVCFLVNAQKRISKPSRQRFIIRRGAGIFFKQRLIRGAFVRSSRLAKIWGEKEIADETAENMRGLYVALTRAKQKLYITGIIPQKNINSLSFMKAIKESVFENGNEVEYAKLIKVMQQSDEEIAEVNDDTVEAQIFANGDELMRRIGYKYPHPAIHISQLAVSELDRDDNGFFISPKLTPKPRQPVFVTQKTQSKSAQAGTAMHMFIQFADFDNIVKNGTKAEAKRLLEAQMLTQEQEELLQHNKLQVFFNSEFFNRIKSSGFVMREKRFSITERSEAFGLQYGEKVQVQGVIDLCFEEDGKLIIVDFKTDRISEATAPDFVLRHTPQLAYYSHALKRITRKEVSEVLLYSFALGKALLVDVY